MSERFPPWELAPKRERPLSLWNPLDYLTLLYWVFFFPQAIRWYVERFCYPESREAKGWPALRAAWREDAILRRLLIQALLLDVTFPFALAGLLAWAGVPMDWGGVAVGVAGGVAVGVAFGVAFGVAVGVAGGVAFGVAVLRPADWLWGAVAVGLGRPWGGGARMAWLPLPGLRRRLRARLEADWVGGLHDLNEVLAYTLQFIPAVEAFVEALEATPEAALLERVARAAEEPPFDWDLLRYGSASLRRALLEQFLEGLFIPERWRKRLAPVPLRYGHPARAACAAFWLWHEGETEEAAEAFARLRALPRGEELTAIAAAIVAAQRAEEPQALAEWEAAQGWLAHPPAEPLRPGTLRALAVLRTVAGEVRTALHAHSPLARSAAIGRANAALAQLLEEGATFCPQPEWPLIEAIIPQWQAIITRLGGELGEAVLREPVANPYVGYSGLPVVGKGFVGRGEIFSRIENYLRQRGGGLPVIILYGHRRMGKSSILRNLPRYAPPGTLFVYLDMQDSAWAAERTELLLRDFAEAIHRTAAEAGLEVGPPPAEADFTPLDRARRTLNDLLRRLDGAMGGRRLILAVDEYELIEQAIAEGRIDGGLLAYLRSRVIAHPWLAILFAGLHSLEEMGYDYRAAFFGQAEMLRVSYLSREEAEELIRVPDPDFALEYEDTLVERLYRLTGGQPYLIQRLCWELVEQWNRRFLREREETPRLLTVDDLPPLLDARFFEAAAYYFDGVWSNISEVERRVLWAMRGETPAFWKQEALAQATGLERAALQDAIQLLLRHDLLTEEAEGLRFASELMQRWVREYAEYAGERE